MGNSFCKNCAYFSRNWPLDIEYAKCRSNKLAYINMVTGKVEYSNAAKFCDLNRKYSGDDYCGPEGKWFKPKPPLLTRIANWFKGNNNG